jgi:acyl-CoA reductase-like NAD-dependent aldehyde dehydrogenase
VNIRILVDKETVCLNSKKAEKLAKRIVCGMCVINDFGTQYLIQDCPFGGCKV